MRRWEGAGRVARNLPRSFLLLSRNYIPIHHSGAYVVHFPSHLRILMESIPPCSAPESLTTKKGMSSFKAFLRRFVQVKSVSSPSNALPVVLGIWKQLARLGQQVSTGRIRLKSRASLSAECFILLAGKDQNPSLILRCRHYIDVCAGDS